MTSKLSFSRSVSLSLLTLSLAALLPTLSGCSLLYDVGQEHARDQCEKLSVMAERNACLKSNRESYEDYEKRRQQLKQGTDSSKPAP
ncbi:hypothetical protein [Roseateles sp.]|uniref:hypothetical protein n=1 Tax=Roseateles sp. TaxID=1971397 RepID=UPI003BA45702